MAVVAVRRLEGLQKFDLRPRLQGERLFGLDDFNGHLRVRPCVLRPDHLAEGALADPFFDHVVLPERVLDPNDVVVVLVVPLALPARRRGRRQGLLRLPTELLLVVHLVDQLVRVDQLHAHLVQRPLRVRTSRRALLHPFFLSFTQVSLRSRRTQRDATTPGSCDDFLNQKKARRRSVGRSHTKIQSGRRALRPGVETGATARPAPLLSPSTGPACHANVPPFLRQR
mmetsp:Transcript_15524/g.50891  ORF Transcript_15524/g.50891 Transcript_15524/m.50891 type:complete len:227 (-) Transcript_15524:58-738(-)